MKGGAFDSKSNSRNFSSQIANATDFFGYFYFSHYILQRRTVVIILTVLRWKCQVNGKREKSTIQFEIVDSFEIVSISLRMNEFCTECIDLFSEM